MLKLLGRVAAFVVAGCAIAAFAVALDTPRSVVALAASAVLIALAVLADGVLSRRNARASALAPVAGIAWAAAAAAVLWGADDGASRLAAVLLVVAALGAALLALLATLRRRRVLRDGELLPARVRSVHVADGPSGASRTLTGAVWHEIEIVVAAADGQLRPMTLTRPYQRGAAPPPGALVPVRMLGRRTLLDERPATVTELHSLPPSGPGRGPLAPV